MKACTNCGMPASGRRQAKNSDGTVRHADPADCYVPKAEPYQRPPELVRHQNLLRKYGSLSAAIEAGEEI